MNFKLPAFLHDSSALCCSVNAFVTAVCAPSANTSFPREEFSPLSKREKKREVRTCDIYSVCAVAPPMRIWAQKEFKDACSYCRHVAVSRLCEQDFERSS